jgi:hypothetical protein
MRTAYSTAYATAGTWVTAYLDEALSERSDSLDFSFDLQERAAFHAEMLHRRVMGQVRNKNKNENELSSSSSCAC